MSQQAVSWRLRAEQAADRYQELAQRRPLLGLPLTFVARYTARQGMLLASAVAFRLFLTLLPLALLLAGVLAGLSGDNTKTPESAAKTAGITGAASQQILTSLHDGHRSWWIAVLAGAFGFLWAMRTLARNLFLVSAHLWQIQPRRPRPKTALFDAGVIGLVLIAILAVDTVAPKIDDAIPGGLLLTIAVESVANTAGWLLISIHLPNARRTWRDLLPGAVLLGVSFAVMHAVSRIYVPQKIEHASQLYGGLGIAAVMLGWLLLIGQVVVASGLVNVVWLESRHPRTPESGNTGQLT